MDRFWSKVDQTADCWNWTGAKRRGYGLFWLDGQHRSAHRVSFEMAHGEIPAGLVVDHICRNKQCVRPSHLRAVTQRANVLAAPSIIAAQVAREDCIYGHPLSGENLHIDTRGYRVCRACDRRRWHEKSVRRQLARESR